MAYLHCHQGNICAIGCDALGANVRRENKFSWCFAGVHGSRGERLVVDVPGLSGKGPRCEADLLVPDHPERRYCFNTEGLAIDGELDVCACQRTDAIT